MMKTLIHSLKWGVVFSTLFLLHNGCTNTSDENNKNAIQEQAVVDTSQNKTSPPVAAPSADVQPEIGVPQRTSSGETAPTTRTTESPAQKQSTTTPKAAPAGSKTGKVEKSPQTKSPIKEPINEAAKTAEAIPTSKPAVSEPAKVAPQTPTPSPPETKTSSEKNPQPVIEITAKTEVPAQKTTTDRNPPKSVGETQTKPWVVPESDRNKANPVASSAASIKTGKELYQKHCASCHGKKGLGDGPKSAQLKTSSGDFTDPKFQDQTDGALFYKTRVGRDDMPSFKKKLPDEEEIWQLVNYIRTFKG